MRLGSFTIVSELGAGAMGRVYEGRDEVLGRSVALKVVASQHVSSAVVLQRLEREARAGARIAHPNVTRLYDLVRVDGRTILVLELVPGGSLADRLRARGPIPWAEAARLGAGIARGLAAVHAAGLVHRDVKPANVLLDEHGEPKLSDLGLVRRSREATGASAALTNEGEVVGTFAYMAPEQAGSGDAIDGRADLYGLGCTLYALLTGRPPFDGRGFELVKAHLLERPRPPRDVAQIELPEPFEALVLRLLEKDPAARGPGASEVAAELDAIAGGVPRAPARSRLWIAVVVVVLVAIAGGSLALGRRSPPPEPPRVDPFARLEWTRGAVSDAQLDEAATALEAAAREPGAPPWVATRATELRASRDLARGLAAAKTPDERHALLAAFVRDNPSHPDVGRALGRLEEEKRAMEKSGWFGEPLPRHLLRGRERPIYLWMTADVQLEVVYVPPGRYLLGIAKDQRRPLGPHELKGYYIGRTEVTWGEFEAFCAVTKRDVPPRPSFWERIESRERHPVVHVRWTDATEFCAWAGVRLPSEQEWEAAARGTDGRAFPWGPRWEAGRANSCDRSCPRDATVNGQPLTKRRETRYDDGFPYTAPVGSFPRGASPCGALDMGGNVWEWCQDAPEFIPGEGLHVIRGGSWADGAAATNASYYNWGWRGSAPSESIGFRILVPGADAR
jgi:formylglycine-generating enzyme required for sulfatase activity/tRNA A-37 threonylcarbamoyl transferase component Bud32